MVSHRETSLNLLNSVDHDAVPTVGLFLLLSFMRVTFSIFVHCMDASVSVHFRCFSRVFSFGADYSESFCPSHIQVSNLTEFFFLEPVQKTGNLKFNMSM